MTDNNLIEKMGGVKKAKVILNTWLSNTPVLQVGNVRLSRHELRKAIATYYISQTSNPSLATAQNIVNTAKRIGATHFGKDRGGYYRKGQYKWQIWNVAEWSNIINDEPTDTLIYISNLVNAVNFFKSENNNE